MAERPFAVFDIDGTIIRWQLFHAIMDALAKHKKLSAETYEQVRAARKKWKTRVHGESFKEYEKLLVETFQTLLKGLEVSAHTSASHETFMEYKDQVYRYTRELIEKFKAEDYLLFAISGSSTEVVSLFAEYYGFDDFLASEYEKEGGYYTGKATWAVGRKDQLLTQLAEKHHVSFTGSIGIGDSESDIAMLELTEHPIAFNPSKKLFERAKANGWKVVVERKNVVYELTEQRGAYCLDDNAQQK